MFKMGLVYIQIYRHLRELKFDCYCTPLILLEVGLTMTSLNVEIHEIHQNPLHFDSGFYVLAVDFVIFVLLSSSSF